VEVTTIGIIGAGAMGTGIAQVAAQAGLRVHLLDISEGAITASRTRLDGSLQDGIAREKLTGEQAEEVRRLIAWDTAYGRLAEADWVIEATFEDFAVKERVLREAAGFVRARAPMASNTSTFPIAELSRCWSQPECFLGMHFFNPPPAMKLVEVVAGESTLPSITEAALALCERLGKTGVIAPDIPGFVVNRAMAALVAAAIDVCAQGGDPAAVDQSIELGLGHRMGPLKTADLVGLDLMLAVLRSLHDQTGHPRFEPPEQLVALVESGRLGRKTGQGFYSYDNQSTST